MLPKAMGSQIAIYMSTAMLTFERPDVPVIEGPDQLLAGRYAQVKGAHRMLRFRFRPQTMLDSEVN